MITLDRTFYIPKGAVCVRHKTSDGLVYLYTTRAGRPAAIAFHGKAQKPDFNYSYKSEAARERDVREFFQSREGRAKAQAEYKAARNRKSVLEVGHILVASWGYDQTNVDWFQITKIISPTMVEVRPIHGQASEDGQGMTGKSIPSIDAFKGEPVRRRVSHGSQVRMDSVRYASLWDGRPRSWSSYH